MIKEIVSAESTEVKVLETGGIKDIKPQTEMSQQERNNFWNDVFSHQKSDVKGDEYFNSYEDRLSYTPKENSDLGEWSGNRGESKFKPTEDTPEGKAALDKLSEKGLDGIEYKNAEPDFSKCAEATVEIDNMTEHRYDYPDSDGTMMQGNFTQADIKCAEKWNSAEKDGKTNWTARDVNDWRHENKCSWHERCDTQTMDLVPSDIHRQCKHLGGVSECKVRDLIDAGGGFDE